MDNPKTPLDAPKTIRVGRVEIAANVVVQMILVLFLAVFVNYLSSRHYVRWDWSHGKNTTLSPQTKAVLENLQKPAQAIVMFAAAGEAENESRQLLREYEFTSKGKLTVEEVDPFANLSRAKELQNQYKFGANENVIILTYDGRNKFVNSFDMAEFEKLDQMQMMMQRKAPEMLSFKGEQVLTSALLELTEPKQNKVYFTTGHGEYDLMAKQIEALKEQLTRQNLQLEMLKLADVEAVPADASLVFVLGPKFDFSERDQKLLTEYWEKKGRLFVATGTTKGKTANFIQWLTTRGVHPQDDHILRVVNIGGLTGLVPLEGVVARGSQITKEIEGVSNEMFGPTQSLFLDRAKEESGQMKFTELMAAPKEYWGETEYDSTRTDVPFFDPKKDHAAPLTIGVAVEQGASKDRNVKLETPRMVVFGNGDFLTNDGLRMGPVGIDLALNAVNWLLNRENLISLPPKVKEKVSLSLSPAQMGTIRAWVAIYIPLIIGIIGLFHLSWRYGKNLFSLTIWLASIYLISVVLWYLVELGLGIEGAKTLPKPLLTSIGVALVFGIAAAVANRAEQKQRAAGAK